MPPKLVSAGSIARRADGPPAVFVCWWTTFGLDAAWVHVAGELDSATSPQLERTLREAQLRAGLVVLDLRELTFMDSAGVHALVNASIRARQVGRQLILQRGPPQVDRMFELTSSAGDVEITGLDPVQSPIQARLPLVEGELAS